MGRLANSHDTGAYVVKKCIKVEGKTKKRQNREHRASMPLNWNKYM